MESLFGIAVLAALGWWVYKRGKRIGSRKGFNAGRHRHRHRRRRRRS